MRLIGKLLLDHETHSALFSSNLLECPHKFIIETPRQKLFYYGSKHSTNPKHPQFPDIKRGWADWMQKTIGQPRLAVVEGGLPPPYDNRARAIKSGAEPGYVSYLAGLNHIKVISPEPGRKYIDKRLVKHFDKDEIQFQYFACIAWQYSALYPKEKFKNYLQWYLDYCQRESDWKNYDFSLDHMDDICLKLTGKSIDKHIPSTWNELINPFNQKSPLVKIARADLDLRDTHVVKELVKEFRRGRSLFIVFSYNHAYRQEPALKKLLAPARFKHIKPQVRF